MVTEARYSSEAPENYQRLLETLQRFLVEEEPSRYKRLKEKFQAMLEKMAMRDVPASLLELLQEEEVALSLREEELEFLIEINPSGRELDREFYRRALEQFRQRK